VITTVANTPFAAILSDYTPAVAAELTVEVYDPATGATVLAASGTGITEPRPGTYRVARTATTAGSYRLRWARTGVSADPDLAEEELLVRALPTAPPDSIVPEVSEVGSVLRARTSYMGQELGTFTANTRPTAEEVEEYIAQAAAEVGLRLPATVPDTLTAFARRLVAIRAAMMIEVSYAPDRTEADSTAYDRLREMFETGMSALTDALADTGIGGVGGVDSGRMVAVPLTTPTATYSAELGLDAPDLLP
jgi:hypothetical protein